MSCEGRNDKGNFSFFSNSKYCGGLKIPGKAGDDRSVVKIWAV